MHRLVIDTDPGVDDALALLMAHAHPDATVEALTVTAGNVGLHHVVRNALKLVEVIDATTPVYVGAALPLVAVPEDAAFVHGRDGFGDCGYDDPRRIAESEPAAVALVRLAREHPGALTYVMLGPLTNLALALRLDPALPTRVKRLVVMGGAVTGRGNISRLPVEFNIGFDPEAAQVVLSEWTANGGPAIELVDWEATLAHGVPTVEIERWLATGSTRARFFNAISRKTRVFLGELRGNTAWHAADALAMACVLEPSHVQRWEEKRVDVELGAGAARGATLVDWMERMGKPANARLMMGYDREVFARLLKLALDVD